MAAWEPAFSFYLTSLGGALASVVVDLHARPQRSHPHCVVIDAALRYPREDGLRDERELDTMGTLEDTLVERLEQALYLGRVTTRGRVQFVFYAATPLEVPSSVADYPLRVTTQLEPDWQTFTRALYPGPFELQTIMNRNVLEQLAAQGDALTNPRELDHFAFFDAPGHAAQAASALSAKGFRVEPPTTSEGRTSLSFHRVDSLADGRIDDVSAEVLQIILANDGAYDGWGCGVVPSAS